MRSGVSKQRDVSLPAAPELEGSETLGMGGGQGGTFRQPLLHSACIPQALEASGGLRSLHNRFNVTGRGW